MLHQIIETLEVSTTTQSHKMANTLKQFAGNHFVKLALKEFICSYIFTQSELRCSDKVYSYKEKSVLGETEIG